ncbi:MAG: hypothetical protein M1134_06650 [Actinobacteria bacterium]|nr:hypothetical protein [Actinomycetota bacterium]
MDGVDVREIIEALETDPVLRAEARRVLLSDDVLHLPERITALSEAVRTFAESTDRRLDETDRRLDQIDRRLDAFELHFAQTDRRLDEIDRRLDQIDRRLDETDRRLDQIDRRLDQMDHQLAATRTELGRLSTVVGGGVEEDAAAALELVVGEREWELIDGPDPLEVEGGEIDVVGRARDGKGLEIGLLVEAKVRIRPADVLRFNTSLNGRLLRDSGVPGDYFAWIYAMRVYRGVDEAARELGLGVLDSRGERVVPQRRSA